MFTQVQKQFYSTTYHDRALPTRQNTGQGNIRQSKAWHAHSDRGKGSS